MPNVRARLGARAIAVVEGGATRTRAPSKGRSVEASNLHGATAGDAGRPAQARRLFQGRWYGQATGANAPKARAEGDPSVPRGRAGTTTTRLARWDAPRDHRRTTLGTARTV